MTMFAYNGEVYGAPGFRVLMFTVQWISDSLEDQERTMIIPWEVDQVVPKMQISHILLGFLMATEA